MRHQPDMLPYVAKSQITQILAAQPHSPRTRVIETQQQMEQGRFSGPARPDKRHPLAARDFEIDRADGGPAGSGRIGEIDGLELASHFKITAKRQRRGRPRQISRCLQCLGNTFRGTSGPLQFAGQFRQESGRSRHQKGIEDERGQIASRYAPGDQVLSTNPEDRGDARENEEDDDPAHPTAKPDPPQRRLETFINRRLETRGHHALPAEGLNSPDGGHRFLGLNRDIGKPVLRNSRSLAQPAAKDDQRNHHQRHDDKNDK